MGIQIKLAILLLISTTIKCNPKEEAIKEEKKDHGDVAEIVTPSLLSKGTDESKRDREDEESGESADLESGFAANQRTYQELESDPFYVEYEEEIQKSPSLKYENFAEREDLGDNNKDLGTIESFGRDKDHGENSKEKAQVYEEESVLADGNLSYDSLRNKNYESFHSDENGALEYPSESQSYHNYFDDSEEIGEYESSNNGKRRINQSGNSDGLRFRNRSKKRRGNGRRKGNVHEDRLKDHYFENAQESRYERPQNRGKDFIKKPYGSVSFESGFDREHSSATSESEGSLEYNYDSFIRSTLRPKKESIEYTDYPSRVVEDHRGKPNMDNHPSVNQYDSNERGNGEMHHQTRYQLQSQELQGDPEAFKYRVQPNRNYDTDKQKDNYGYRPVTSERPKYFGYQGEQESHANEPTNIEKPEYYGQQQKANSNIYDEQKYYGYKEVTTEEPKYYGYKEITTEEPKYYGYKGVTTEEPKYYGYKEVTTEESKYYDQRHSYGEHESYGYKPSTTEGPEYFGQHHKVRQNSYGETDTFRYRPTTTKKPKSYGQHQSVNFDSYGFGLATTKRPKSYGDRGSFDLKFKTTEQPKYHNQFESDVYKYRPVETERPDHAIHSYEYKPSQMKGKSPMTKLTNYNGQNHGNPYDRKVQQNQFIPIIDSTSYDTHQNKNPYEMQQSYGYRPHHHQNGQQSSHSLTGYPNEQNAYTVPEKHLMGNSRPQQQYQQSEYHHLAQVEDAGNYPSGQQVNYGQDTHFAQQNKYSTQTGNSDDSYGGNYGSAQDVGSIGNPYREQQSHQTYGEQNQHHKDEYPIPQTSDKKSNPFSYDFSYSEIKSHCIGFPDGTLIGDIRSDCETYFVCKRGEALRLACPKNKKLDARYGACTKHEDIKCTNRPILPALRKESRTTSAASTRHLMKIPYSQKTPYL